MKKLFAAAFVVFAVSACGVPTAGDVSSSTSSRGDALEVRGEPLPPLVLDFGEPLDIVADTTDARLIERANTFRPEETFFYNPFSTGGRGHCH